MVIGKTKQISNGVKPDIRFLNDMKEVLYDRKWADHASNFELYYMYRGVKNKNELRYDITVIPPLMLGQEFVKTKGHAHQEAYGEVYIVLAGQAFYLLQKYAGNKIEDVYAVKAKKGDVVVIPAGYGHITINPSKKETLKEANWVCKACQNVYDSFVEKQGASYYFTTKGWIKNKKYGKIPKLRFAKPLKAMPKNLDFLYGKNN
ncbi:MAG: glucose-6-phosphate isomerase family protein [Candidatus Nealsonbacteria bacterium]